jgi:hypothetical protein
MRQVSEITLPPVTSNFLSNFNRALSFQADRESFFGQVEQWYLIKETIAYIHGDAQHWKDSFLRTFSSDDDLKKSGRFPFFI